MIFTNTKYILNRIECLLLLIRLQFKKVEYNKFELHYTACTNTLSKSNATNLYKRKWKKNIKYQNIGKKILNANNTRLCLQIDSQHQLTRSLKMSKVNWTEWIVQFSQWTLKAILKWVRVAFTRNDTCWCTVTLMLQTRKYLMQTMHEVMCRLRVAIS